MKEFIKRFTEVAVTEEGLFLSNDVPEDLTGSIFYVNVVHSYLFVDNNGNLHPMFLKAPDVMDSDRNIVPYPLSEIQESIVPVTTNDVYVVGDDYQHAFPTALKNKAQGNKTAMESDGTTKVLGHDIP